MSLQKTINEYYHLQIIGLIGISKNVYKIKTEHEFYCLKIVSNKKQEMAYNHILTLKLQHFVALMCNKDNEFFTPYKNQYFYIMEYLTADKEIKKELKLKYYYRYLAYLHNQSFFYQHVEADLIHQQKQDLLALIQERKKSYEDFMKQFEIMRFRSPSGWMLVLNYCRLMNCFHQAYHFLNEYCDMMKEKTEIRLSLTYNHFSYDHIYVYENKLISIDHMTINFCIYDIYDLLQAIDPFFDDCETLFDYYQEKVQLLKEEKLLLCCLLSIIPVVHFSHDEERNICEMSKILRYEECISRLITKLKIDC